MATVPARNSGDAVVPEEYDQILDDAHIAVARRPESMRAFDVKVKPLPPRLWERLRQQLQAEYRRATGEVHATLTVQHEDPTHD